MPLSEGGIGHSFHSFSWRIQLRRGWGVGHFPHLHSCLHAVLTCRLPALSLVSFVTELLCSLTVVYPCLSYSSDDHHLLHSCLGTGARVGTQNRFRLYRASLVHPVSSIALLLVLVFRFEQYHDTATSGFEYSVFRILDRPCPVCVGKHVTVTRDGQFCERFRDGGSTVGSGARRGTKPWQENGKELMRTHHGLDKIHLQVSQRRHRRTRIDTGSEIFDSGRRHHRCRKTGREGGF